MKEHENIEQEQQEWTRQKENEEKKNTGKLKIKKEEHFQPFIIDMLLFGPFFLIPLFVHSFADNFWSSWMNDAERWVNVIVV